MLQSFKNWIVKKTRREGLFYSSVESLSVIFGSFIHWLHSGHLIARYRIKKYLKNQTEPAVQFGTGSRISGKYLNTDILESSVHVNVTKKLPFPSNSFKYAYHSHLIEHIYNRQAKKFLLESYRILKPGGVLRIATPDLKKLSLLMYTDKHPSEFEIIKDQHMPKSHETQFFRSNYLNEFTHLFYGHRFVYDEEYLSWMCKQAGFSKVVSRKINESDYEFFKNTEKDYGAYQQVETFILECVK